MTILEKRRLSDKREKPAFYFSSDMIAEPSINTAPMIPVPVNGS
jgi:hypothetical protein